MNRILWLACLPAILISGELKDSLIKAKKSHQPMMVYVKSDTCQFCNKMKNKTLNDISVLENTSDFVFIVADKNDAETKKYLPSARYTPTVYFISPEFKVVNTVKGYLGKDDFNLWVDDSKRKLGLNGITKAENVSTDITEKSDTWMYDMPSAVDYAEQSGKQIMLYVDSSDSKWSKKMLESTLVDSGIKEALDNFVWVKLQKDSSDVFALGLHPKYTPTIYFMKADKSSLATVKGYLNSEDFLQWINYAKSKI
jgi:thioredoxin-related protein